VVALVVAPAMAWPAPAVAVGREAALPSAAAARGWGPPFRIAGPEPVDVGPAQLALSSGGELAVGFSLYPQDAPARARALLAIRPPVGTARVRRVPGAQEVLALSFAGGALELLTGAAPAGRACCERAQAVAFAGGRLGRSRRVAGQLAGTTLGDLEPLPGGGLLAVLATDQGVWVAQSGPGGRFGGPRRISSSFAVPWAMAATETAGGRTEVAWLEGPDPAGESGPRQMLLATGSPVAAPTAGRVVLSSPAGTQLDEVTLAPRGEFATAAWVESWFDRFGVYHAEPVVADLAGRVRPRPFAVPGQAVSGLALAGGPDAQVLAWRGCGRSGACEVWASCRPRGGRFSAPVRLGAVDPGQPPAVTVTADGTAVVGWIDGGQVFAATRAAEGRGFGPPRRLGGTRSAADLTLVAGPFGGPPAVAAWTQGTRAPSLVGAELR
jgi:hypothetical protein